MEDQGFDFKPTQRREAKKFEPPPWERDAFEELQRRRQSTDEVAPEASSTGTNERPDVELPERVPLAADAEEKKPDEGVVLEMLAGLAAEEPPASKDYLGVSIGAALVLGALGGMLIVWGMAALVSARRTGWMGQLTGAGLGLFGAFFLGMGVWLMYRTLKQRGVL